MRELVKLTQLKQEVYVILDILSCNNRYKIIRISLIRNN